MFGRSCGTWPGSKVTRGNGRSGPQMAGHSDGKGWIICTCLRELMLERGRSKTCFCEAERVRPRPQASGDASSHSQDKNKDFTTLAWSKDERMHQPKTICPRLLSIKCPLNPWAPWTMSMDSLEIVHGISRKSGQSPWILWTKSRELTQTGKRPWTPWMWVQWKAWTMSMDTLDKVREPT